MKNVAVSEEDIGTRLDVYATEKVQTLSRASIGKLCDQKLVLVNGTPHKGSYKLRAGDKVTLLYNFDDLSKIPEIDLEILYEDDDCIVVNKPIGVLTHSKGAFNPEATVATFISSKIKDMEGDRAGIVHRLDRATSGVIITAKTPEALSWLQKQFSQRRTKKSYYAVVTGALKEKEAIIDMPIERNPNDPKRFRVGNSGKPAQTHYEVVAADDTHTLLLLKPATGRTHQLRVHLAQLGVPIVGDQMYDGEKHERMLLHAYQLEITLPNRERKIFTAELPPEFQAIIKS